MSRFCARSLAAALLGLLSALTPSHAQDGPSAADSSRYAARRQQAFARLGNDVLIVRSKWAPSQFTQPSFEQGSTFYYFTGADRLLGAILVLDGSTRRAELFLPRALPAFLGPIARAQPAPSAARATEFHVDGVSDWSAFVPYIDRRLSTGPQPTIRVDEDVSADGLTGLIGVALDSSTAPDGPRSAWMATLRQRWPNASIVPGMMFAMELRAVKDSAEIATLRRVATLSVTAFNAGLARFAPGRRQRDVEAAVVEACTTNGGDGPSFWPWAMSGPMSAFPAPFTSSVDMHHLDREMRAGEIARYDIGCQVSHYMGDVGRTVPVSGTFTPEQAEVIDLLVATYRAGLAVLRDGVASEAMLRASVAEAERRRGSMRTALGRRAAMLISQPDSIPFWQIHGVGLDAAESLPPVLRAGMVLDYEPIFVVDGQGFYMEDMVLVTPNGHEVLTKALPYSATEIERAMRRGRAR
jgi:Xaa-Pro aminopeptidase